MGAGMLSAPAFIVKSSLWFYLLKQDVKEGQARKDYLQV